MALDVFFTCNGGAGNDLDVIRKNGPLRCLEDGHKFPFIVAPECPENQWQDSDKLMCLFDHVQKAFFVDTDRVYITGLSMGGSGKLALANAYPERFAAIAPVCGFFTPGDPGRFRGLPIQCFHGAMDELIPINDSLRMVSWIREHGGNAKLTLFPDAEHNCWQEVYSNPDLYKWFLGNRKPKRNK